MRREEADGRRRLRGQLAGRRAAAQLYRALSNGDPPPAVLAPDLNLGTVHMDVTLAYSRFYRVTGADAPAGRYFAVGPAPLVVGFALGHAVGASIGHLRAINRRRPRWWGNEPARVVLTTACTWCQVRGIWLQFAHAGVTRYQLQSDGAGVLSFVDGAAPLRLYGPAAWCHAVLFAYLAFGPPWHQAAFLEPIRWAPRDGELLVRPDDLRASNLGKGATYL